MEANGMSDIEGKAARVAANERGAVSEFQLTGLKEPTEISRDSSTSLGMTDHKVAADQPSSTLRLGKHGPPYNFRPRWSASLGHRSGPIWLTGPGSLELIFYPSLWLRT